MRASEFQSRINALARKTGTVKWTRHAWERMMQRDIPLRIALSVLRTGQVRGRIEPGGRPGEWKGKLVLAVKGRREAGVVTLLLDDDRIVVKTVEWEDLP